MGCFGTDVPDYPTEQMDKQIALSEKLGERYLSLSEQQQAWAEDQWGSQLALLQDVIGSQTSIMNENQAMAMKDRARYDEIYQPIEDDLIADFMDYDSPERRDLASGRAQAGVQHSFDAQRRQAEQRLAGLGVDPSMVKGGALDLGMRMEAAAQQSLQGNTARNRTEDVGRSLRAEAINIGKGYPSQVAGAYGTALTAGNSAVRNMNNTVGMGANTLGTGGSWGGMGTYQNGQTMAGINNQYSGQLAGVAAEGPGLMGALGGIAGQALGGWASSGFAKPWGEGGGSVPDGTPQQVGPSDTVPAMLEPYEYIFPEDAARFYGTDKLNKMVAKAREGTEQQGVEVGEMPRPDGETVVPGGPSGGQPQVIQGLEGGGPVGKPQGVFY